MSEVAFLLRVSAMKFVVILFLLFLLACEGAKKKRYEYPQECQNKISIRARMISNRAAEFSIRNTDPACAAANDFRKAWFQSSFQIDSIAGGTFEASADVPCRNLDVKLPAVTKERNEFLFQLFFSDYISLQSGEIILQTVHGNCVTVKTKIPFELIA